MARAVKRSWSRWRPSLSLETWCLWPAFSSRAPTETPCSSASKMPRYVWPHHSHFLRMKGFDEECVCFSSSSPLWSMIQARMISRRCRCTTSRSRSWECVLCFEDVLSCWSVFWWLCAVCVWMVSGRVCSECAHPHGACGSGEPLRCHAGVRHLSGGSALQEGHADRWTGRHRGRGVWANIFYIFAGTICYCYNVFVIYLIENKVASNSNI